MERPKSLYHIYQTTLQCLSSYSSACNHRTIYNNVVYYKYCTFTYKYTLILNAFTQTTLHSWYSFDSRITHFCVIWSIFLWRAHLMCTVCMSVVECECLLICVLIAHLKAGLPSIHLMLSKLFSHSAIATGCVTAHTTANEWDS